VIVADADMTSPGRIRQRSKLTLTNDTDIDLPDGNNDGKIRLHISGDIQYTPNRLVGVGVPDAEGSLRIYKH